MTAAPVASNPVMKRVLIVGAIVNAVIIVGAAIIGYLVASTNGMWSGIVGVLFGFVFLAITAASILIVNRWNGDPIYPTLFFAVVLGGWVIKFGVFLIAFFLIRDQPWLHGQILYVSLVVAVLASLIVDVVVMKQMRIPIDVDLPQSADHSDDEALDNAERPVFDPTGQDETK